MTNELLDFDINPITEEEVVSILGNDYKEQGDELVFQCPSCKDTSCDNLKFNKVKGVIKCFACDYGKTLTSIIARRRFNKVGGGRTHLSHQTNNINTEPPAEKEPEIAQQNLDLYYWNCHLALMKNKDILRAMYEKHTILPKTACDCGIGYDKNKDMLVFPSKAVGKDPRFNLGTFANGAEYREYKGDKKVRRISGYEAKICRIWGWEETNRFILCEGYKDAYNLYQFLQATNPKELDYLLILTIQNGTNSLNYNQCMQRIALKYFDKMYVCFDNDEAGNKATNEAINLYPKIEDLRPKLINGYNDIQERFKAEIAPKIDINKALNAEWLKEYENEDFIV